MNNQEEGEGDFFTHYLSSLTSPARYKEDEQFYNKLADITSSRKVDYRLRAAIYRTAHT